MSARMECSQVGGSVSRRTGKPSNYVIRAEWHECAGSTSNRDIDSEFLIFLCQSIWTLIAIETFAEFQQMLKKMLLILIVNLTLISNCLYLIVIISSYRLILSLEAKLNLLHNYMNVTWIRIPSETRVTPLIHEYIMYRSVNKHERKLGQWGLH